MAQDNITPGDADELTHWLTHFGLNKYDTALREAGLEEFAMVKTLDDELISDFVEEAKMKKIQKKMFIKAIAAVKDGRYGKPTAPPQDTDDIKQDQTEGGNDKNTADKVDDKSPGNKARATGRCKRFDIAKGFGFITCDDGSGDIFVHRQEIHTNGDGSLCVGEVLEFDIINQGDGRLKAVNVTGPNGSYVKGASSGTDGDYKQENENEEKEVKCACDDDHDLSDWLNKIGLAQYDSALRDAGCDKFEDIQTLDDDEIDGYAEDANMKSGHKRKFKKAVKALQKDTGDQMENEEMDELRQSRQDLNGYIERKTEPENAMDGKKTRTVIFIGQTGAGKTTLINSMCNHLEKVCYDEPFRYQLICEQKTLNKNIAKDSTKSQTQNITQYHLEDIPAINYSLNIIDTPGFGDTEGPAKDKQIRDKFRDFFNKVPTIDGIYFVVKASDTRLGATQKYIFNMVLDLFGDDVKDNIFILFTFSDGAEPPALKAVNKLGVPYADYFQINNSGFGLPAKDKKNRTHEMFFDLGNEQFEGIFKHLSKVNTISTSLSAQTLRERDNITNSLFVIGQNVKTALDKQDAANKTYKYLEAHKSEIDANKDFKIPDQEVRIHRDPKRNGCYTTYCRHCVTTCHTDCGIPDDAGKKGCAAMRDGYCTVCPNKCKWSEHTNKPYVIRRETVTVYKTNEEMAAKYNAANAEKANCENIMKGVMVEIERIEKDIMDKVDRMKNSVKRLQQIALNKTVLTDDEYYDTLIAGEKQERKSGWEERVAQFESLKKDNKLLRNVMDGKKPAMAWQNNPELAQYKKQYSVNNMSLRPIKPKQRKDGQSSGVGISIPFTNKKINLSLTSKQ